MNPKDLTTDDLVELKDAVDREISKRAEKLAAVAGLKIKGQRKRVGRNVDEGK